MGQVISSDMPGTEETESMSDEQLEAHLSAQESGLAKGAEGAIGDPAAAPKAGAAEPKAAAEPAAKAEGEAAAAGAALSPQAGDTVTTLEAKIADLTSRLANLSREAGLGAQRALQAKIDKLEGAIERLSTAPPKAASPEEQARLNEEAQAQAWLKKNSAPLFQQWMQEQYGHLLPAVQQQAIGISLMDHVNELGLTTPGGTEPIGFKELDPFIGALILEDDKAAKAGDAQATARMQALASGQKPTELIFRAYRKSLEAAASKAAETAKTAAGAKDANAKAAAAGGRLIKPGAKPPQDKVLTKEDVEAMSEEDRDKVSDEDFERLYPVGRGRR